jgi:hypothetical protein
MIHIDQSETRTYFACPFAPSMDLVSESIRERTIAIQSDSEEDHPVGCPHSYRVCDEIWAAAMKAFNYSDVEIVRKLRLDSSVSYLKLARDGFFGDSG